MLLILVSFLCHATKSTTRKNYENGISWDGQFFSESGIKISIAFGIRDQNFDLNNGIIHEKLYLVTTLNPSQTEQESEMFLLKGRMYQDVSVIGFHPKAS